MTFWINDISIGSDKLLETNEPVYLCSSCRLIKLAFSGNTFTFIDS